MATLLLIDGHSQAYRAYFGVKTPLTTSTGELTTAIFGFARKLMSVLREYQPDAVAVAFDLGDTRVDFVQIILDRRKSAAVHAWRRADNV